MHALAITRRGSPMDDRNLRTLALGLQRQKIEVKNARFDAADS